MTAGVTVHEAVDQEMVRGFHRDGFVVVGDVLSAPEVAAVLAETERLCAGELGRIAGADTAPAGLSGDELLRQFLCIHQPHKVSSLVREVMSAPRVITALTKIIGPNIKAMQSMVFIKASGKPGQPWHQDEFFIPTRDRSLTAAWIALDDVTVDNGCLWVLPGSHRRGVLYPDRVQDHPDFDCSIEAYDFPYEDQDAVPVEMPAGSAVIFNGYLLHRSLKNSGRDGFRRALVNHYMSAESLLPWGQVPEGVHVAKHDHRDVVLVAGTDPYAYKGLADLTSAHTRPDKDGGCDR